MWHLTACKILVSLSFLNWIKNELIFLSYLWINVGNINSEKNISFQELETNLDLQAVRCHILWLC